ncbi:odorant receptor 49b-like [Zeugodacus cucurbitae]|uniref:odorant receptor 49b-like n=1 Tax=Zeugodacus cucurbitae TaxID=28588 RepID=UPI0023D90917|nr:odorant receptor 49b-like [Zeugodacus cucurbitae]
MEKYKNLPLYSVNVKIFLQLGLIGASTRTRQILLALVPVFTYLGQILNLFKTSGGDIGETGMNFYMMAQLTHCLVRFLMVVRNNERFVQFLQCIDRWYKDIEQNSDPEVVHMLQDVTTHAQKLTRIGFYTATIGALCSYIYPFSFEERKFILDIHYLFFDAKQSPFYEFFFLLQALVFVPTFVFVYLPFSNLLLISLKFGEVILMDLCVKLRNISNQNEVTQLRQFKECIWYHERIITFRNDLEYLISIDGFFHVALFSLMLCMLLFFLSLVQDYRQILSALAFISFNFYVIGITYYYANNFSNESLKIANAAYDTPWYEGNSELRKCVQIMIARSQRPLELKSGGLYPMTLENFQAILRMSYSYFSMLQGFSQQ